VKTAGVCCFYTIVLLVYHTFSYLCNSFVKL
jgi:hypothetical protein